MSEALLAVRNLSVEFRTPRGMARAIEDVSFTLHRGEVLGLVGESGCGKSVTSLAIMRLLDASAGRIAGGGIWLDGTDLTRVSERAMLSTRGRRISMIFQDPMTALNPLFPVGDQVAEVFRRHLRCSRRESRARAVEAFRRVQIPDPQRRTRQYPHELSGGMHQRVMIAMALACDPEVLIADEPTTALDVTIQAQIVDMMRELADDRGTAILMISHDLGVVATVCDRVAVMYAGQIIEEASAPALFSDPRHPYTRALMRAAPRLGERARHGRRPLTELRGTVPDPLLRPPGCRFHNRCSEAFERCAEALPLLKDANRGRQLRCLLQDRAVRA